MKQIINGKRYDTDTATLVAGYSNGRGPSDFNQIYEDLFITKTGNWFMYYEGGAHTKYAESCGPNSYCGSHGIEVLTPDEAYQWLEDNKKAQAIEDYFAFKVEDA